MPSASAPSVTARLAGLPASAPDIFTPSDVIRIVEVAKKYNEPDGTPITRIPEYTTPGGPNSYHSSKIDVAWTQGFFPGLLWLLVERERLVPGTLAAAGYTEEEVVALARRWQGSFRHMARHAINHDQGFRFQLPFGRDLALTGDKSTVAVLVEAADSLVDRYDDAVGCIRSWDQMRKVGLPDIYRRDNNHEHYLVIIDNMMNLDLLYEVALLTGEERYAAIASTQAEKMIKGHIRPDGTTYHVVDYTRTGDVGKQMTHQGYADESCWSRGQAWGIYGYAQCALRTGRKDFLDTSRRLADAFIARLPESGVPWWDFDAPKPCPYDASAGTIAARGFQMLYELLLPSDPAAAEYYLSAGFKLIDDTVRECASPAASLKNGAVSWGEGAWETILQHSTINGNQYSNRRLLDHGLVYADYYYVEFANEALKLKAKLAKA
ncbi:hypothetical protein Q8F55_000981 [Vanrija albida]|uniref:Glucuronyl hydrolase n=1 Tax=Vanrija albida TaxID=181172 RepID=A0ABR3QES9_9TREE